MKFGTQSRSSSLIINIMFEIADLELKLKTLADCLKIIKMSNGLKIAMCSILKKFGTQNKSKMLIMNIFLGFHDLDPKL